MAIYARNSKKERGMEVNETVDERYDLVKRQRRPGYFYAKAKFGTWTLRSIFNGGTGGVNKQMDIQQERNYYDLLLTEELRDTF
jgi:hypothetical protein